MKNKIYLFIFLLLGFACELHAQIVTIPDFGFKAKLINVGVDTNADGEIQVSEALAITNLDVSFSNISDITGIQAFVNLDTLKCNNNNLTSLICTSLTNLKYLCCNHNSITNANFDITTCNNLRWLNCNYNDLVSFNTVGLTNLELLDCRYNEIINLDVTSLMNLEYLDCSNQTICDATLYNLDVHGLANLKYLDCSGKSGCMMHYGNALTNLDLTGCNNLELFRCSYTKLTTVDINHCSHLDDFQCSPNSTITTVFLKNGSIETNLLPAGNSLIYVCADPGQVASIQQYLDTHGCPNVIVNSLCSIAPGGNYNTVSGEGIFDGDMNGCTPLDLTHSFLKVGYAKGIDTSYIYTNGLGSYNVYLDSGAYVFMPFSQNPNYLNVSPISSNIYFANDSNNVQIQDFCVVPNGLISDVEVLINSAQVSVPGFTRTYNLVLHNKGTNIVSGDITLDFMESKMSFVGSSSLPSAQTTHQVTWAYNNLLPFQTQNISFSMYLFPPPTNNTGETFHFIADMPLVGDTNSSDNTFISSHHFQNSQDPNDKTCLEGPIVNYSSIGDYLHYNIRFQNTGNYPADHIVIVDTIDVTKFDISTLELLETSHTATVSIENGVLQFYFENIMLPDSFSNEPESHGYVVFKIKTKSTLAPNSIVSNKAEIYFDYNAAVLTNTAITAFGGFTSVSGASTDVNCSGTVLGSISIIANGGANPIGYGINGLDGVFQSNPTFTGLVAGNYHVFVKDSLGFIEMLPFTILHPMQPLASFTSLEDSPGQFSFTNASTNAISYLWDFGNGSTDTMMNPIYTYSANGNYTVMLIASNSCGSDTSYQSVVVNTVGVAEVEIKGEVRVYPNPSGGELQVVFESEVGGKFILYDVVGKRVFEEAFEGGGVVERRLLMEGLGSGSYLLRIETARGNYSRKVVKE